MIVGNTRLLCLCRRQEAVALQIQNTERTRTGGVSRWMVLGSTRILDLRLSQAWLTGGGCLGFLVNY
jgi:hypothetical protein